MLRLALGWDRNVNILAGEWKDKRTPARGGRGAKEGGRGRRKKPRDHVSCSVGPTRCPAFVGASYHLENRYCNPSR